MRARNGLYFSHIRGESSMLLDSIAEAIRIGEEGGVGVQVSHVKASGKENWPKIDAALRMIEDGKARGVDVLGDAIRTTAAQSSTTSCRRGRTTAASPGSSSGSRIAPRAGRSPRSA
jgi:N-acyl-D-amino-acid deacylase